MTVLTASQPFTSALVTSNVADFRHAWVWRKTVAANFTLLKFQPSKHHEDVLVFGPRRGTYNAQMEAGEPYTDKPRKRVVGIHGGAETLKKAINNTGVRYPSSVQTFPNPNNGNVHPTQKPVALMEYLIRTYTNPGDTVLDNCMGSGTTGVACVNTGRNFIGIEKDPGYFGIATARIAAARLQKEAAE
jgi:site-specific DNA-methyltransferase (adenine-specific)